MNRGEEYIDAFRVRSGGDSLIVDERARHLAFEILRLLFGLVFMAPAGLLLGAWFLPEGVLGMKRSLDADQLSAVAWIKIAPFLSLALVFLFVGFFYAFARARVEVTNGKLLVGRTWFGLFAQLKPLPLTTGTALELQTRRRGVFGGVPVFVASIAGIGERVELFSCSEKAAVLKLAGAVSDSLKLPVCDKTGA